MYMFGQLAVLSIVNRKGVRRVVLASLTYPPPAVNQSVQLAIVKRQRLAQRIATPTARMLERHNAVLLI